MWIYVCLAVQASVICLNAYYNTMFIENLLGTIIFISTLCFRVHALLPKYCKVKMNCPALGISLCKQYDVSGTVFQVSIHNYFQKLQNLLNAAIRKTGS